MVFSVTLAMELSASALNLAEESLPAFCLPLVALLRRAQAWFILAYFGAIWQVLAFLLDDGCCPWNRWIPTRERELWDTVYHVTKDGEFAYARRCVEAGETLDVVFAALYGAAMVGDREMVIWLLEFAKRHELQPTPESSDPRNFDNNLDQLWGKAMSCAGNGFHIGVASVLSKESPTPCWNYALAGACRLAEFPDKDPGCYVDRKRWLTTWAQRDDRLRMVEWAVANGANNWGQAANLCIQGRSYHLLKHLVTLHDRAAAETDQTADLAVPLVLDVSRIKRHQLIQVMKAIRPSQRIVRNKHADQAGKHLPCTGPFQVDPKTAVQPFEWEYYETF